MSGWIKMGVGLRRHPKVVRLAGLLKADRLRVVGALHAVWCVFDEHSQAGRLEGYSGAVMDDEIGWRGFSKAMQSIGWLLEDADGLEVPDYEEHNGPTAKRRALDAQRKGRSRAEPDDGPPPDPPSVRMGSGHESGQMSACDADEVKNREEKRREEREGARATRLPTDWSPGDAGLAFAASKGLTNGRASAELEKFRDHWTAKGGADARKADWQAAWRTWVRRSVEYTPGSSTVGARSDDVFSAAR